MWEREARGQEENVCLEVCFPAGGMLLHNRAQRKTLFLWHPRDILGVAKVSS